MAPSQTAVQCLRSEASPLDLNNLPEEYGKQAIEESSTTTATSANSTRLKKKKCGKEGKEDGNVYECRFCSLKFCKSQALGGHMNRHRQERETETLNRARQLVFSNDGFATVGGQLGLRDLSFGGSGQSIASIPRGGDSCLQFRPVYPLLRPPGGQLQQYIYPAQTSPRTTHPYAAVPSASDYYLGRVLAGQQHPNFGGAVEGNRVRYVAAAAQQPNREGPVGVGGHAYGLRSSDPATDPF